MHTYDRVAAAMADRFGTAPDLAVVLGSGLGAFAAAVDGAAAVPYPELGLPPSGVAGHAGKLVVGEIGGRRVAVFAGRWHAYEGGAIADVVAGVRAFARWGGKGIVFTSAVGSVDPALRPGQVVVVSDHVNFLGNNPLKGPNDDRLGPRFPDLAALYSPRARAIAHAAAGRTLPEGVYAAMSGPSYETPAEIRMLRLLGARVVGMSLVPEAIAASHAGLEVLALAVVSNLAAGLHDGELTHEDVTASMAAAAGNLCEILSGIVSQWESGA